MEWESEWELELESEWELESVKKKVSAPSGFGGPNAPISRVRGTGWGSLGREPRGSTAGVAAARSRFAVRAGPHVRGWRRGFTPNPGEPGLGHGVVMASAKQQGAAPVNRDTDRNRGVRVPPLGLF